MKNRSARIMDDVLDCTTRYSSIGSSIVGPTLVVVVLVVVLCTAPTLATTLATAV